MRARTAAVVGAVLVAVLAGCSDDKGSGGDDPTSAAPTGTASDPTSAATTESSATVVPASGPLVSLRSTATFHLTSDLDWDVAYDGSGLVLSDAPVEGLTTNVRVDATEFAQIGSDIDYIAKIARKGQERRYGVRLRVGENRVVDGLDGYVLEGSGKGTRFYEFGSLNADNVLTTLSFQVPSELDIEDFVEPILASLTWQ